MFRGQAEPDEGCSKYRPTMRFASIVLASILLVCELALAAFEYIHCRIDGNPLSAVFAGMFTFHSVFTIFYIIGACRLIECFMVPWLTLQLIFLTTFAMFTVVWWIATLLSLFSLVQYFHVSASHNGLTNTEFFVFTGVVLTVVLLVSMKISHVLYKGFVSVRNQNMAHYRITVGATASSSSDVNGSVLKPSYV